MNDKSKRRIAEGVQDVVNKTIFDGLEESKGADVKVIISAKNKVKMQPYTQVFQAFSKMASNHLTPASCKVLFYFIALMEYQNYISIDQLTIAEHCGLSRKAVNQAIKQLIECNVIMPTPNPNDKRRNDYFINPMAVWRGNSIAHKDKLRQLSRCDNQLPSLFDKCETFNPNG